MIIRFLKLGVFVLIMLPVLVFAGMTQQDLKDVYSTPVIVEGSTKTINIDLPVDAIDGYRWFLTDYNHDYIDADSYKHNSVDVEGSKWGATDSFKMKLHKRFKKVPQIMVLHFECLKPWDTAGSSKITKDVIVLNLVD